MYMGIMCRRRVRVREEGNRAWARAREREEVEEDALHVQLTLQPPRRDVVNMELNKATGVFKAWVNEAIPFTIKDVSPSSKVRVGDPQKRPTTLEKRPTTLEKRPTTLQKKFLPAPRCV